MGRTVRPGFFTGATTTGPVNSSPTTKENDMFARFKAWLVFEDENMPADLLLGNLDRLDGLHNRKATR